MDVWVCPFWRTPCLVGLKKTPKGKTSHFRGVSSLGTVWHHRNTRFNCKWFASSEPLSFTTLGMEVTNFVLQLLPKMNRTKSKTELTCQQQRSYVPETRVYQMPGRGRQLRMPNEGGHVRWKKKHLSWSNSNFNTRQQSVCDVIPCSFSNMSLPGITTWAVATEFGTTLARIFNMEGLFTTWNQCFCLQVGQLDRADVVFGPAWKRQL